MQRIPEIALVLSLIFVTGCKVKWAHNPKGVKTCWPVTNGGNRILKVTGPSSARAGECAGPYTITSFSEVPGKQCADGSREEPSGGDAWPVASDTEVTFAGAQYKGSFYLEGTCANAIQSAVLYENQTTLQVWYKYYRVDFTGDSTNTTIIADASRFGLGRGKLDLTIYRPDGRQDLR